jgi:hypothetical protein
VADGRIIICGTGRAGTSFLVRLLTRLGYDTGYTPEADGYNPAIRAGCELRADDWRNPEIWDKLPQIVKSPYLSECLDVVPVPIAHVLIPVRDLDEVAESRKQAGTAWYGDAEPTSGRMAEALGRAVATCMTRSIPFTLLQFPRLVENDLYCLDALTPAFPELRDMPIRDAEANGASVTVESFRRAHAEVRAAK